MTELRILTIYGGTFDPVHWGHLRSIKELHGLLNAWQTRLLPSSLPPHRENPGASAEQRLRMLQVGVDELAVSDIVVDDRELHREGYSYTIDTLEEIRRELSTNGDENISVCLAMGSDAFALLDTWHRWQDVLSVAHIIVMQRPGSGLPEEGVVAQLLEEHRVDNTAALQQRECGRIYPVTLQPWPISATAIRESIVAGRWPQAMLPASVGQFIQKHQLYGYDSESSRLSAREES